MGLARNLLGVNRERDFSGKIQEILLAIRIESRYSKREILLEYLNRVSFGRLSTGIGAASEAYFGKPLRSLTPAENLALLALVRNPSRYDPVREPEAFLKRMELVTNALETGGVLTPAQAEIVRHEPLVWTRPKPELPYVADLVKSIAKGEKTGILSPSESSEIAKNLTNGTDLVTSVDSGLTRRIEDIADSIRTGLQYRNVSDYGILVVDRATMKVRVLIGGADYAGQAGQVNAVFAPRQVGSTMKPFTYLLGIETHGHSMSDTILDAPASYLTADGNPYEPKNYSLGYRGNISLSEALAGSVNVPAVKMAQEVGVGNLLSFVRSLGVTSLRESADHYGLALTLGVGEISLWELLRAYTIFSDEGRLHDFSLIENTAPESGKSMAKPEAVSQIVDALSSHVFKSEEFPTGSALDFGEGKVFVKTGTSRNFRDNYAVGFTEKYLIGIWAGNKDGSNMRGVSGASGAGEIFAAIVGDLGESEGRVVPESKRDPTIRTPKPPVGKPVSGEPLTISSPLPGTRYRKDSGVPEDRQTVTVKYWSQRRYEQVNITLSTVGKIPKNIPISDGKLPIGTLVPGNYTVRVEGVSSGKSDVATVRFEME
jgi:penicillin-binding protein 1C